MDLSLMLRRWTSKVIEPPWSLTDVACRKWQLAGIELEGKGLDKARVFGVVDVHVELLADQA